MVEGLVGTTKTKKQASEFHLKNMIFQELHQLEIHKIHILEFIIYIISPLKSTIVYLNAFCGCKSVATIWHRTSTITKIHFVENTKSSKIPLRSSFLHTKSYLKEQLSSDHCPNWSVDTQLPLWSGSPGKKLSQL